MKAVSPQRQSQIRSLTKNEATTMRQRLCIQPLALSWRMAASTNGMPVRPKRQASNQGRWLSQGNWRHWGR